MREADAAGEPLLVLAGGSNVVIADAGFPGHRRARRDARVVTATATAASRSRPASRGTPLVARMRRRGAGRGRVPVGHPGLGRRDADPERRRLRPGGRRRSIVAVRVLDRAARRGGRARARRVRLPLPLEPSSRATGTAGSVLAVTLPAARIDERSDADPLRRAGRARSASESATARRWRTCARPCSALRRGKGMVLDPADPDSVSAPARSSPTRSSTPTRVRRARGARRATPPPRFPAARRPREDLAPRG